MACNPSLDMGKQTEANGPTNLPSSQPCRRERARAVTVVFGSLDVGSAIGLVICGPLIAAAGWPSVFYLFAVLGLLWCLWWPLLKPDSEDLTVGVAEQPAAPTPPAGGM